jgi:hypothetical protein
MQTGIKFFSVLVGLILCCAWTAQYNNGIQKTEWLIGNWENRTPKGTFYESWNKTNDNELSGKSYIIKENDTVVFETIQLLREQERLFYIPIVSDQNNKQPIRFAATMISENRLVFENPQHDFPQIISYTKISADSLVAQISGIKNGKERRQIFPMKRVK